MSSYQDLLNRFPQHIAVCKLCGTPAFENTKWGLCPVGEELKDLILEHPENPYHVNR